MPDEKKADESFDKLGLTAKLCPATMKICVAKNCQLWNPAAGNCAVLLIDSRLALIEKSLVGIATKLGELKSVLSEIPQ